MLLGKGVDPPHGSVVLPDRHRCEHAVIVGKTGSGKTHLLELLACQLARRGEGFSFFDFHGDASLSLIGRLLQLPHAEERLIVVDPSHPTRSPGINVLESGASDAERFRKVSEISSILRQRWSVDSFGARTEELLRNSLYTLAGTGRKATPITDAIFPGYGMSLPFAVSIAFAGNSGGVQRENWKSTIFFRSPSGPN